MNGPGDMNLFPQGENAQDAFTREMGNFGPEVFDPVDGDDGDPMDDGLLGAWTDDSLRGSGASITPDERAPRESAAPLKMDNNEEPVTDKKAQERAAYWASKGKKVVRPVTRLACGTCHGMPGTRSWTGGQFQWNGEGDARHLIHVGCPGPREAPKPTPAEELKMANRLSASLAAGLAILQMKKGPRMIEPLPEKKENKK